MGTQKLDNIDIERMPTTDGTISDLLKSNPNVQFSNGGRTSTNLGEISPENVSFHGERFYNNNWMIDGMSNNDNINPGANKGYSSALPDGGYAGDLPAGGTQSFWINSDIIDSADVYDSNISAKYGQFTGGVIDAKIKDADTEKQSGSISYRTTRDAWTKFNIYGETAADVERNRQSLEGASQLYYQPQFVKNNYAVNINQPINDKTAIMFSYNRADSTIPHYITNVGTWVDQKRVAETFLLRGIYEADGGDTFKLTGMYSPHEQTYFLGATNNSAFTNTGGGFRINGEWEHFFDGGQVNTYLGYRKTGNDIEHSSNIWSYWFWSSPSINWNAVPNSAQVEGGFGHSATEKSSIVFKQDYELDPIQWGETEHNLAFGLKADWARAKYQRYTAATLYQGFFPANAAVVCNPGDISCIPGENFANLRTDYPVRDVSVSNNHYSTYIEDNIKWRNLEITPGLRLDYDQFLGNTDIAPRFTASYDVFGDKTTRIFGGLNRYYADSMIGYALSDAIGNTQQYTRFISTAPWMLNPSGSASTPYGESNLKTPYSDEINLGITQQIGNTEWTAKWVNRHGRDQFSTDKDSSGATILTNDGRSKANTFTLTGRLMKPIEWDYATLSWDLSASYSKTESNFTFYEDDLNGEPEKIIFDGKLMDRNDMPARDYNTPWRLSADINLDFPDWNLNWTNRLNYTAGYSAYDVNSNVACPGGNAQCGGYTGLVDVYEKTKYDNYFTLDWRFLYTPPIGNGNLEVSLDVLNVLNAKIEGSSATGGSTSSRVTYKPGRQFWLGAKYSW